MVTHLRIYGSFLLARVARVPLGQPRVHLIRCFRFSIARKSIGSVAVTRFLIVLHLAGLFSLLSRLELVSAHVTPRALVIRLPSDSDIS